MKTKRSKINILIAVFIIIVLLLFCCWGMVVWSDAIRNDTDGLEQKIQNIESKYNTLGNIYTYIKENDDNVSEDSIGGISTNCTKQDIQNFFGYNPSSNIYSVDLDILETFLLDNERVKDDNWGFLTHKDFFKLEPLDKFEYNTSANLGIDAIDKIWDARYIVVLDTITKDLPERVNEQSFNSGYYMGMAYIVDLQKGSEPLCRDVIVSDNTEYVPSDELVSDFESNFEKALFDLVSGKELE